MSVQVLPAATQAKAPGKAGKGHLNQVDLVRVLTFASVIMVHVITYTNDGANVTAYGVLALLHYTRSVFFFLTGFVLVYTYRKRPLASGTFWRRRMALVGIPYVIWTAFYFGIIQQVGQPDLPVAQFLDYLWGCIYKGVGWYHLYFLLVSLQFYILFPFVLAVLKATVRHHKKILIGSAILQVGISLAETYLPAPSDPDSTLGQLWTNDGTIVFSYQFFLLAGCLAAFHYEAFQAWITSHAKLIWWGLGLSSAFALTWYGVNIAYGHAPGDATGVLQPEMLPWYAFVVLAMYLTGSRWAARQETGSRSQRIVAAASQRSFGVFLVHPAMLWVFLNKFDMWFPNHIPQGLYLTLAAYAFAVVTSLIFVEIVIRSPLAKVLIGRERIRRAPKPTPVPVAV
ncbi:acyltransferase [Kutzneria buriramensis]|uniref:Peptidoglycan/LPS O-acetylase OafA/YrhL n=1 Tax=Kutzneria buriramensis TaxID=1045776 RepID=A0A3E0HFR8_9PSEU|nr:acyltransferase [Kutzneria buriramensis]REH44593.1 peptidoglycan/LPS O-acetylase OafA/YrhL [Kutzneria buriramensis]